MEEKHVKLKDGSDVLIRPMRQDDLDRSLKFFAALPREDRAFLRVDVTKRSLVEERMFDIETGSVRRIVAILEDEIIADGALELAGHGWKEHAAELRLIVARNQQRKGLGMLMARELYAEANAEHVQELVVKMMRPQNAAHSIFKRLGFRNQTVLPEYVKDREGKLQDMILGRCNLKVLWDELEDYFAEFDYPRKR